MAQYPATATATKLPVTKANTAGETALGSASLTGATGTTAYGQISASLSADTIITAVNVSLTGEAFSLSVSDVDIAYGGAGSEVVLATVPLETSYNGTNSRRGIGRLSVPLRVASGQRLAVRFTDSGVSAATTVTVRVFSVPYANLEGN